MNNNKLETEVVKPHPILAGIINYYCLSLLVTTSIAVLSTLLGKSVIGEYKLYKSLVMLAIIIICTIIYSSILSKKLMILSPGEYFTGMRIVDRKKVWSNPYKCNRFGVFFIVMINLILIGNEFDSGIAGQIFTITEIFIKILRILLYMYIIKLLSEKNFRGFNLIILITLISTYKIYPLTGSLLFKVNISLLTIYAVIYYIYYKKSVDNEESSVAVKKI